MKNFSISKKLLLGFGSILVFMILSAAISFYSITGMNTQIGYYSQYTTPNIAQTGAMQHYLLSVERDLLQAFLADDIQSVQNNLDQVHIDREALKHTFEEYANTQRNHDRDEQIKNLESLLDKGAPIRQEIESLLLTPSETNKQKALDLYYNQYLPICEEEEKIAVELTDSSTARSGQQAKEAQASAAMAYTLSLIFLVISVIWTIIISRNIRKSILTPVNEIVGAYGEMAKGNMHAAINYKGHDELGQMAMLIQEVNLLQSKIVSDVIEKFTKISQGDLRLRVDLEYPGDYAILKQTMEDTVFTLNNTMLQINTIAGQVATGSDQVSSGAQALATGSTEQAASVEELTATSETIAKQAEENSAHIKIARKQTEQAGEGVKNGNEHMRQLDGAMADINAASNQIAHITKVIEDIAFQTNILALNAAIEAARAGAAGKGFAVVADEVGSLAAKSADAAKETSKLIQNSVATVSRGTQITSETAQVLQALGMNAQHVMDVMIKIEEASAEQVAAIEQMRDGLSQISAVVQTNAATAEENSATSEEMSAQAALMRQEVGKFKLAAAAAGEFASSSEHLAGFKFHAAYSRL